MYPGLSRIGGVMVLFQWRVAIFSEEVAQELRFAGVFFWAETTEARRGAVCGTHLSCGFDISILTAEMTAEMNTVIMTKRASTMK